MIGLSLSFCVRDIIEGRVNVNDVKKIIASTRFPNRFEWQRGIRQYKKLYWNENPGLAGKIVRQLRVKGKIEQPRLKNNDHFPIIIARGNWVKSEDEIRWNA